MNNKIRIVIVLLVVLLAVGVIWISSEDGTGEKHIQETATGDPVMIVMDFYEPWIKALRATETDPYQAGLADSEILSTGLRDHLASAQNTTGDEEIELDPVTCQSNVDTDISARQISETDEQVEVLVRATEEGLHNQSVVTLVKQGEGWYIDDIKCTTGEVAPEREFDFIQEGFLLKNVPEPLDSDFWHIVFEQNGEQGHTAPLTFTAESQCIDQNNSVATCKPADFQEATKAVVKGDMTETGVKVKRLEIVQ